MPDSTQRRLAVILHADVIASTRLVQQNEALAHQRMVEAFRHLAGTVNDQGGEVREIRGDALLATFARGSDAVTAALEFQRDHVARRAALADAIQPELRIGIAMGEVIIADGTLTGAGVVLAQRLEQLAEADGVVIQGAVYETLPKHLPMLFDNLGEREIKGFDDSVRAYRAQLRDTPAPLSSSSAPPF